MLKIKALLAKIAAKLVTQDSAITTLQGKLPFSKMQYGSTGQISVPPATNIDTAVTFSPAFTSTPKLIVTMRATNAGGSNFTTQRIYGLSSTGFTARVNNSAANTTYYVYFDWVAFL